jgi:hypothetical protein
MVALEQILTDSCFVQIRIKPNYESKTFIRDWALGKNIEDFVVSATIEAIRPDNLSAPKQPKSFTPLLSTTAVLMLPT